MSINPTLARKIRYVATENNEEAKEMVLMILQDQVGNVDVPTEFKE